MERKPVHHLDATEKVALEDFLTRLQRQYGDQVQHVILFGSKSRGDFQQESDVDLLIVLKSDDWRLRDQIVDLTLEPLLEHKVLLSPKVVDQGYFKFIARRRTPFYRNVHQDGVELWTRAQ
jgi:predicted nucleotidyltransferase